MKKQVEVTIEDPTTEVPFALTITEYISGALSARIVPVEGDIFLFTGSSLTLSREGCKKLCVMREALKSTFEANGMDFEKDQASDYAPLERRLKNESDGI